MVALKNILPAIYCCIICFATVFCRSSAPAGALASSPPPASALTGGEPQCEASIQANLLFPLSCEDNAPGRSLPPKAPHFGFSIAKTGGQLLVEQKDEQHFARDVELHLLKMLNKEREAAGLPALGLEDALHWASQIRAAELLNDFSHTRPSGKPYYTAFDEAGFVYVGKWHGENVSYMRFSSGTYDAYGTAKKLFESLKNSPGYYQNILDINFAQAGVGVSVRIDGDTVHISSAQLFSSL